MKALRHAIITSTLFRMRSISAEVFRLQENPFAGEIIQTTQVPGVQVELPLEDWEEIMQVYLSHYQAMSENPAVRDAWQQYRMTLALTTRT